jgi:hypothetical protein
MPAHPRIPPSSNSNARATASRSWRASLFRIRSTQFLGRVDAPDRAAAKIAASEKFNLTEEQRRRLVVQEGG